MLHVGQSGSANIPDTAFRAMFAARKAVFVDLLKWDVPVLAGKYEVDQFDDGNAHYLVLTDSHGGHLGSARLLPTIRPHILDSFYADLCEAGPPRGEDIFEVTRFCLDRGLRARDRRFVRDTLVVALTDYALANGIRSYCALAEMNWFQQILAFGWRCRPLGLPRSHAGTMLAALQIEISSDTPAMLADAGISTMATLIQCEQRAAA